MPRISVKEFKKEDAANPYKIKGVLLSAASSNDKILALTSLNRSAVLKKAAIDKRFSTAHKDKYDAIINIEFESGIEALPIKYGKDKNIYDIPLVQEELVYLLEQIISNDALSKAKITFTSGTRVNDNNK